MSPPLSARALQALARGDVAWQRFVEELRKLESEELITWLPMIIRESLGERRDQRLEAQVVGLSQVMAALGDRGSRAPKDVMRWLFTVDSRLANRRPVDLLRSGKVGEVVELAHSLWAE